MPFLAPSALLGIKYGESLQDNIDHFIGLPVVDYPPTEKVTGPFCYRFRCAWDDKVDITQHLKNFLASDQSQSAQGLVIGSWVGQSDRDTPEDIIQLLCDHRQRLPSLVAIYVGDIVSEENEISWIKQCDVSPLLEAFPRLELLRVRGGDGLAISRPHHGSLRSLIIETGGLDVSVIQSLAVSQFPELEHLELWLGAEDYGATSTVEDLLPLMTGTLFPKLKYLGLRDSMLADEIAAVVVNSPIVNQIETLDLSLGTLSDTGVHYLMQLKEGGSLAYLDLHMSFISPDGEELLSTHPLTVNFEESRWEEGEADDWRFVAVGE